MNVSTSSLVLGSAFLFAACGTATPAAVLSTDVPASVASSQQAAPPPSADSSPSYALYQDGVIGRGKSIVLFFAKKSDPFSQRSDEMIRRVYASGAALLSTYRIDSDTSTGARLTYGIIVPDTFVLLGADGARQTNLIHPDETELKSFLAPAR